MNQMNVSLDIHTHNSEPPFVLIFRYTSATFNRTNENLYDRKIRNGPFLLRL